MAADDMRFYQTFYGVHINDWQETFSTVFVDHHKLLVKEYVSEGCDTTDGSNVSLTTHKFLYPHHIKKTYFIEGVIEGHITLVATSCTTTLSNYRVTVCKIHEDATDTELFTTGWVTISDVLAWDAVYSVGDEMVYPFWIDAWEKEKLTEFERIYLKVEVTTTGDSCCSLYHSNDSTWEDVCITIPFVM